MSDVSSKPILVSDLDATFLHEETYDCGDARVLLRFLAERGIPLIFASSKTRREIEGIQEDLGVRDPFICENGSAVVIPPGCFSGPVPGAVVRGGREVIELGCPVRLLQDALGRMAEAAGLRVRSLMEMDLDEVARVTGLSREGAALARDRDYDIPFLFEGPEGGLEDLRRRAEGEGFRVVRGGRLVHLMGDVDKGRAFAKLRTLYETAGGGGERGGTRFVVALGDAENDLGMLREADRPVVIPTRSGWNPKLAALPGVRLAPRPAPDGWMDAVRDILRERGLDPP